MEAAAIEAALKRAASVAVGIREAEILEAVNGKGAAARAKVAAVARKFNAPAAVPAAAIPRFAALRIAALKRAAPKYAAT